MMNIRFATKKDIPAIKELFRSTILSVNLKDYIPKQVGCWAARGEDPSVWEERINEQYFILAEENNTILGFAALKLSGYLNFMFVHKDYQGKGVASFLLKRIEEYARLKDISEITADVSITAQPFFSKKGYIILEQQTVCIGISMTNYKMSKVLS
ncbi:MAG: GNAT family N-acetyltransferase [Dysgonomonas sp. 37-18]|nr:GNAT family N-acetyltransferase [Dysgonomonas mossii]OJX61462.1 MAG: GNAT family N-acetyltransferase [Dysgonomonas sp. 37-18]